MATPASAAAEVTEFMQGVIRRNPGEPQFHQAVQEVAEAVIPFLRDHPDYRQARILDRLTEPDRSVAFRVTWENDQGEIRVNRAWRVQVSNALGPYKGGLRFHPSVSLSVLKFLGFEQVFKNSLTGLPMGGAKGGSDFNPKGRSDREVMRFCQSLMVELQRYISEDTDVPAGDIGVGEREIGYLYGAYSRLRNRATGVITGKGLSYGGSLVRTEATGYGCGYFCESVLRRQGDSMAGRTVVVSGSGNVAIYAAEKAIQLGATVVTLSDSDGFIYDPAGLDEEKLAFVKDLKEVRRGRIREYPDQYPKATFHSGQLPWSVPCDIALPCATENELTGEDAQTLRDNGVRVVAEGANMPLTPEAIKVLKDSGVQFVPAKAANAGGVAVSGLEQAQNAQRLNWSREEVDDRLRVIMEEIYQQCVTYGTTADSGSGAAGAVDYQRGANIAGFVRVADAMLAQGVR